jgi:hypothetical protein
MSKVNVKIWRRPRTRDVLLALAAITFAASSALMVGCSSDNSSSKAKDDSNTIQAVEQPSIVVTGTTLKCDSVAPLSTAPILEVETPNSIQAINISRDAVDESHLKPNTQNTIKRLSTIVDAQTPSGDLALDADGLEFEVHPILITYAEQVVGGYELGDGSADIGDPNQLDDIFASLSMDNGATFKKVKVGDTAGKASATVHWDGNNIAYGGHSHKPTMNFKGDNILVAWLDKYCPSGNPFDLLEPETEDYFKVNGSQGSIDYTADYGSAVLAPNGKELYEVPFSCVWTARGVFVDDPDPVAQDHAYTIQWRQAQQMTSGTRDANKIWIAPAEVGFAIAWQEDPVGLRSGKGLGPGVGFSGATTNHGADIWYTYIHMEDFADVCTDDDCTATTEDPTEIFNLATKPKPAINYTYPVRVSNNESCSAVDNKLYCADHCLSTVSLETNNSSGTVIERCVDTDPDYMTRDTTIAPEAAVLDGDTGASRPALKILKTNEDEFVAILVYEETKGLSESDPQDQGITTTDIALEGKSVYFESFFWDQPVTVSSGRIVNLRLPEVNMTLDDNNVVVSMEETGYDIYENARRVVIIGQTDACQMAEGDYPFGLMYKQGFETQGGPSDMYVRMNTGFTYEEFEDIAYNVSARETVYDDGGKVTDISWSEEDLLDQSYDNPIDNTFSPRGYLRGSDLYTGFEYTPNWRQTAQGTTPNNFWIHRYVDGVWHEPQQITAVLGPHISTLDPRFHPTPKGSATSLASDASNPDVLYMGYGTFDMETGLELDLLYTRSTDKGANWEFFDADGNLVKVPGINAIEGDEDDAYRHARLAHKADVEEKELQALPSPDGTMMFNVWVQETEHYDAGDPDSGLESRFGLVEYNFDPAAIP